MVYLVDNYYMSADTHNFILKEKFTIQDKESENYGKEDYRNIGYYANIKDLLNGIIKKYSRKQLYENNVKDIKTLTKAIKELEEKIDNLKIGD